MKKYLIILMVFVVTVMLCACSQPSNETTSTADAGSVTSNTSMQATPTVGEVTGNVTVDVVPPEGWEPMDNQYILVHYMKDTASFMIKEEGFYGDSLDSVVQQSIESLKGAFDNVVVLGDVESITIDGKDAKKFIFTCSVGSMEMKYMYAYLSLGGKTYSIVFGDMADSFDSLSADYDAILDSIVFNVK